MPSRLFDYTGYHQTVAASRLEAVMKIEADRMRNLVIDAKEVEPERQVVREERRSRVDNSPAAKLREQLNATIYLAYPIAIRSLVGIMKSLT